MAWLVPADLIMLEPKTRAAMVSSRVRRSQVGQAGVSFSAREVDIVFTMEEEE